MAVVGIDEFVALNELGHGMRRSPRLLSANRVGITASAVITNSPA
jgi:hypothetical protein